MSLIKNNNGITLRLEKSNSLTFDEMDQNFSSFFYSASTVQSGDTNKLRLFYTGSNELDSGFEANRYMEVLLPKTPESSPGETVSVPGCNTQIIFNCNDSFGASADLVFFNKKLGIGLSEPTAPLHVTKTSTGVDTQIRIEPNNSGNTASTTAYYSIGIGNTTFLKLGKTDPGSGEETKCMHLFSSRPLEIGYSNFDNTTCRKIRVTSQGVAIGECISSNAVSPLSIQSTTTGAALTIGSDFNSDNRNSIGSLNVHANKLPGSNTQGLLIQSPVGPSGGNVVIGVNSNGDNNESFSVIRGCQNDFASNSSANCSIATFKADGNVGIGQVNPKAKLHVQGNISGSGDIKVEGCATFNIIPELERTESFDDAPEQITKTLVQGSGGLVQYLDAAPIPKGGIIMWGGLVSEIPTGWVLCNGQSKNGIETPNLTNRFIAGAAANTAGPGGYGVNMTGGSQHITPSGTIEICKLALNTIPPHHHFFLGDDQLYSDVDNNADNSFDKIGGISVTGTTPSSNNRCVVGYDATSNLGGSKDRRLYKTSKQSCLISSNNNCIQLANKQCSPEGTFTGDIASNLPPYYTLAFIMYVGE